jgi:hypothetical protein
MLNEDLLYDWLVISGVRFQQKTVTAYACVYLCEHDINSKFWYVFYGLRLTELSSVYSDVIRNQAFFKLMSAAMEYNPDSVLFDV